MKYLQPSFQIPPPSSTAMCCEACVYGGEVHEEWCPVGEHLDWMQRAGFPEFVYDESTT